GSVAVAVGAAVAVAVAGAVGRRDDVDELAALALAELHAAGGEGEERVVATAAHVLTGVEAGAALAHQDRTGGHERAVEGLHAEALRAGVAAVAGGAAALGLRHGSYLVMPVISMVA